MLEMGLARDMHQLKKAALAESTNTAAIAALLSDHLLYSWPYSPCASAFRKFMLKSNSYLRGFLHNLDNMTGHGRPILGLQLLLKFPDQAWLF